MTVEDAADDELERLYGVPPEEFTALRKELVVAAKKRGDTDAARAIGAARRPTAAAWVVNLLVRRDPAARPRLSELTEALRAAHSAMDGARIRELTAVQRKLVDGLVRAGFAAAGYADVTAALRNDVTDTLQAAIADPGVAARLGRLTKAERWSGFGDFGDASTVVAAGREPDLPAARARAETAAAAVAAAQASRSEALDLVAERRAKLTTARRRYERLLESVSAAEQALNTADADLGAAERAATAATERLDAATSELALAESDGHSAAK